jgi:hypothetical protein
LTDISSRLAVWDLNDYLLSDSLIASLLGYEEGITEYKPFWPIQEEPESSSVFIRYIIDTRATSSRDWWRVQDTVTYFIYSQDVTVSARIAMQIMNLTRTGAGSAGPLNTWLKENGRTDFRFLHLGFINSSDGGPADEEYGIRPRAVTIDTSYVYNEAIGQL